MKPSAEMAAAPVNLLRSYTNSSGEPCLIVHTAKIWGISHAQLWASLLRAWPQSALMLHPQGDDPEPWPMRANLTEEEGTALTALRASGKAKQHAQRLVSTCGWKRYLHSHRKYDMVVGQRAVSDRAAHKFVGSNELALLYEWQRPYIPAT